MFAQKIAFHFILMTFLQRFVANAHITTAPDMLPQQARQGQDQRALVPGVWTTQACASRSREPTCNGQNMSGEPNCNGQIMSCEPNCNNQIMNYVNLVQHQQLHVGFLFRRLTLYNSRTDVCSTISKLFVT